MTAINLNRENLLESFISETRRAIEKQFQAALDEFLIQQRAEAIITLKQRMDKLVIRTMNSSFSDRIELQIIIKD